MENRVLAEKIYLGLNNNFDIRGNGYVNFIEKILDKTEIIKDKHGKPIIAGQKFKFKYLRYLNEPIDLIGSFNWNDTDLRYEIDVFGSDEYVCLSYVGNGVMRAFEIIDENNPTK